MSIMRTALPLVLLTGVLTGCAGLQKTDWPTCAAVGGVTGAALGATESSSWAGGGALLVGGLAGAYCWVHGDGDEDGDGVPDSRDKCPGTPKGVQVDANGCPPAPQAAVVEEVVVVKEETIVIRDVHFQFDSAKLTQRIKPSSTPLPRALNRKHLTPSCVSAGTPTVSVKMPTTRNSRNNAPIRSPNT